MTRSSTAAPPRRGRPTRDEAQALDDRIRDAALDAFVANGFDGTAMETVATLAGVSKRTLYAKFPTKQDLFASVVLFALARSAVDEDALELPDDDLGAALRAVGAHVLTRVVAPDAVKLRRLAVLDARHFPALSAEANLDVWRSSTQSVVALLEEYVERGEVVVDDVELAADQFIAMVAGASTILADLGVYRTSDDEDRHLSHAVRLFLRGAEARR